MNIRHVITAADPARRLPKEALALDVDVMLHELAAQADPARAHSGRRSTLLRRHRLDLALAAVVAALLAAAAFLPIAHTQDDPAGRSSSTSRTSSADARATANALLADIELPTAATRVSTPPASYLSKQWMGLACRGTVSVQPHYWFVPGTTLRTVAQYLKAHRPAGASRLAFNHDTDSDISDAFTSYRPNAQSEVVIALATTPTGIGIRADADVAPGSSCIAP